MIEKEIITAEGFDAMVLDTCYDKQSCGALGIDYCNITGHDITKIRSILSNQYEIKE